MFRSVLAALTVTATLAAPPPAAAAPTDPPVSPLAAQASAADAAPTPVLDWRPCAEPGLEHLQCAVAAVPLDYDNNRDHNDDHNHAHNQAHPGGPMLDLAVVRQPATDPERRVGTLFTAVGGPGGSGIDAARNGLGFGELARRFDIVTFDQRGIGRSRQVRCFASAEEQERFWVGVQLPPVTPAQERAAERASRAHARGCAAHSPDLIGHLTTVDAARDMDLLRRAVGEPKLIYTGGSYASYLGAVYGALFGDRVRALHLVAVLDPVGYTNATLGLLWQRSAGTEEVLREFARLCARAGRDRCPLAAPTTDAVLARNAAVLDALRRGPVTVGRGEEAVRVRYADVVPIHATLLYDTGEGWPALAALIAELERGADGDPTVVGEVLAAMSFRLDFLDSYLAISCADNTFPRHPGLWPGLATAFEAHAPTYGRHWLYQQQACAAWPAPPGGYPQRHTGPWRLRGDVPALLVNNRYDPVTPLAGARTAERVMGDARLVVVEGHGHSVRGRCTDAMAERYLIDLELPPPGATCAPDRPPFA
ncbi:alpha/beta hydrolase fold [Amycolatopsis arida]|uniref:Alpha/beta hydrolase fold n=1 Tax=Amycolatopsis arida TaxID=587909 RepID=A0A1I5WVY6_9PSEU|nr:alpha/beta hydrolase [Amycolatopsis arida]TDX92471.1 alpha/beta hydrolase family protein [Amycolatopsis arida]SFQ23676.1 alpha/beta hydrolase fold [Amycolatopsis arida]